MGENNLTDLIPENGISFNFINIEKNNTLLLGTSGNGRVTYDYWYPIGSIVTSNGRYVIAASPHAEFRAKTREVKEENVFKLIQQALPELFKLSEKKANGGLKFRDAETCTECAISIKYGLTQKDTQNHNIFNTLPGYETPQIRLKSVSIFNENFPSVDITFNEENACPEYIETYRKLLHISHVNKRPKGDKKKPHNFAKQNYDEHGNPLSYQAWDVLFDPEHSSIKDELDKILRDKSFDKMELEKEKEGEVEKQNIENFFNPSKIDDFDDVSYQIKMQNIARKKRRNKSKSKNENICYLNKQDFLYVINEAVNRILKTIKGE
jgi:hypothetical protein